MAFERMKIKRAIIAFKMHKAILWKKEGQLATLVNKAKMRCS